MPAGRFYIAGLDLVQGMELELPAEIAHQARDVLRLAPGDVLGLLDGAGGIHEAHLLTLARNCVRVRVEARRSVDSVEPPIRLVLCQGMLRAAKYEMVLQKCTELGVAGFIPLLSERAVVTQEEMSESKQRRWTRIVAEAMEQCGGTHLPQLLAPQSLEQALSSLAAGGIALVCWEEEHITTLRSALQSTLSGRALKEVPEIGLFVGPEGGFSVGEVTLLVKRCGAIPATLGRRILRAETAAVVAVTLALDAVAEPATLVSTIKRTREVPGEEV